MNILEPILQENKDRFVLFPIIIRKFGRCIRKPRRVFGQLKRSIFPLTYGLGKQTK